MGTPSCCGTRAVPSTPPGREPRAGFEQSHILPGPRHVARRRSTGDTQQERQKILPRDAGRELPEGQCAVIVRDGAGCRRSKEFEIPSNLSLFRQPPCNPELKPIETLIPVLKHGHLAPRVLENAEHVRTTVTDVWHTFIRKTEEIMRLASQDWAKVKRPQQSPLMITSWVWYSGSQATAVGSESGIAGNPGQRSMLKRRPALHSNCSGASPARIVSARADREAAGRVR